MGKVTGFMEYARETPARRPAEMRTRDWLEIYQPMPEDKLRQQGARCMDCGVPFCHTGCPVTNVIPDWNDLVYHKPVARRDPGSAFDQQFSGVHGTNLPGAVRSGVRAGDHGNGGGDQEH